MENLIFYLIGWVIFTEISYIIFIHRNNEFRREWLSTKIMACFLSAVFILFQVGIIYKFDTENTAKYINLLWEFLILGGVFIFFYLNRLIAKNQIKIHRLNKK